METLKKRTASSPLPLVASLDGAKSTEESKRQITHYSGEFLHSTRRHHESVFTAHNLEEAFGAITHRLRGAGGRKLAINRPWQIFALPTRAERLGCVRPYILTQQ